MGIILDYLFTCQAVVVMTVHTQTIRRVFIFSGSFPGPEKCRLRIVHHVAAAADARLSGRLIPDVRGFRRHLAQIVFGTGNIDFIAVALGANFR